MKVLPKQVPVEFYNFACDSKITLLIWGVWDALGNGWAENVSPYLFGLNLAEILKNSFINLGGFINQGCGSWMIWRSGRSKFS